MATLAQEFAVPSFLARPEFGKTVLVVEDDRFVRRAASELLRESGFEVLEAESVVAAWTLFWMEHQLVDAVLCDANPQ
jgi:CheY-like chemotaxis protein